MQILASFLSVLLLVGTLLVLMGLMLSSMWDHHCSLRREFIMIEGMHEIAGAIASGDHEAATGAVMEHFHRMSQELSWQNKHSWSVWRPFTLPKLPDFRAKLERVGKES